MVLTKDNNFVINGDSEAIKNLEIFKDMNFEEIDFYIFYVNYLSKKETENKKVLVGYNGIDGKEDINEIRDSRSRYGRKEKSYANEQSSIIGKNSANITVEKNKFNRFSNRRRKINEKFFSINNFNIFNSMYKYKILLLSRKL